MSSLGVVCLLLDWIGMLPLILERLVLKVGIVPSNGCILIWCVFPFQS